MVFLTGYIKIRLCPGLKLDIPNFSKSQNFKPCRRIGNPAGGASGGGEGEGGLRQGEPPPPAQNALLAYSPVFSSPGDLEPGEEAVPAPRHPPAAQGGEAPALHLPLLVRGGGPPIKAYGLQRMLQHALQRMLQHMLQHPVLQRVLQHVLQSALQHALQRPVLQHALEHALQSALQHALQSALQHALQHPVLQHALQSALKSLFSLDFSF